MLPFTCVMIASPRISVNNSDNDPLIDFPSYLAYLANDPFVPTLESIQVEYDIVLVTRNRPVVLAISLPLMASQDTPPANFIIVDASDNHGDIKRTIEDLRLPIQKINFVVLHSTPGITHQRNVGLTYATSPVVIFPDDDSLWFPDTASSLLAIYKKDIHEQIGGVCAGESAHPPPGSIKDKPYSITWMDKLKIQNYKYVRPITAKYFPDPLYFFEKAKTPPSWLRDANATLSGPMAGFRMSFRRDLIRSIGFDESLGEYALSEDIDASLGILKTHMIVCASEARVYHYKFPANRTGGKELGMMQVLNRAYIVCKHNKPVSLARKHLRRYLLFRLFFYSLQFFSTFGRQKLRGSLCALPYIKRIQQANAEDLHNVFCSVRKSCALRLGLKHYYY